MILTWIHSTQKGVIFDRHGRGADRTGLDDIEIDYNPYLHRLGWYWL